MLIVTKQAIFDMPAGTVLEATPLAHDRWETKHPHTGDRTVLVRGTAEECDVQIEALRNALKKTKVYDGFYVRHECFDTVALYSAVRGFLEKIDEKVDRSHSTNGPDGEPVQRQQPAQKDG